MTASNSFSTSDGSPPVVCQVLHSLSVGGAEVLATRLARSLHGRFRFVFACLDSLGTLGEALAGEGFRIEVFERRPGFDLACARKLAKYWKTERVSVVHAHQYTPCFYSLVARGWRSSPPILFTEHGRFHPDYPRKKRMLFNRWMFGRRDHVVAVGQGVRHALDVNEGIQSKRVEVVYNGVPLDQYQPKPAARAEARSKLGCAESDYVVLFVARLDPIKDHPTAIRAFKRLVCDMPNAKLVLVGEGPEQATIEREIASRGLANHVRMLGRRTDVASLYHGADAFLLTSVSEGIPLTIIEAMASGVPIVATDVGGLGEVIEHGKSGLLAPSGDDMAIAGALARLASDNSLRGRLIAQGEQTARERFSESANHARYVELYRELARG